MHTAEPDPFAQRVGTVLRGKWKLVRLLGVGGMAAVYVGEHHIGRLDAVKILHPEVARSAEARARFEQEAHAVNHLGHPGAVRIFDIDRTEDGTPFLVMELLEGESLAALRARGERLAQGEMLALVEQLLDVLQAAHARGIVHRDIKPDNLFVQHGGKLKVLDFGIARLRDAPGAQVKTRTGMALGTPSYMSPEQVKGVDVDHRTDLFAVGAVMFELVTGCTVHDADSEQDMLVKMLTVPAPPLARLMPDAPRELGLVIDRALAFEPDDRYPDAATMRDDVRALAEGRAPPYASSARPPRQAAETLADRAPAALPATRVEARSLERRRDGVPTLGAEAKGDPVAAPPVAAPRRKPVPLEVAIAAAALVMVVVLLVWLKTGGDASDVAAETAAPEAPSALGPTDEPEEASEEERDAEKKQREADKKRRKQEREAEKKQRERARGRGGEL